MSSSSPSAPTPVRISYKALASDPGSQHQAIAQAFGSAPGCLGVILVDDLPSDFLELREKLFRLAHAFASLPEEVRETLARPEVSYLFGWSHGKEVMNGRPDLMKGSYYANPLLDVPDVTEAERNAHPEYYAGNVWPRNIQGMEEFEPTFKALGKLVFDVGVALARACGPFMASATQGQQTVETLIANSKSNKARLLHYFPEPPSTSASSSRIANDALCGTHLDHSLLTGLCSAMYLSQPDESSAPIPCPPPSETAGLWIYPRHPPSQPRPEAVRVSIPPNCLAFQTGEALELLTAGKLAATPHFVSGNAGSSDSRNLISRETFAFFLQPDVDDVIGVDGETFGQFTKRVLGRHYATAGDVVKEAED